MDLGENINREDIFIIYNTLVITLVLVIVWLMMKDRQLKFEFDTDELKDVIYLFVLTEN